MKKKKKGNGLLLKFLLVGCLTCAAIPAYAYLKDNPWKDMESMNSSTQGDESISSIEITKMPNKTTYFVGEKFSRSGMRLTVHYADGTSKTTIGYKIDKDGALTLADTEIIVSYKGHTAKVPITVIEKQVATHLEISSAEHYTYKVEAEDLTLSSEELGTPKEDYFEYHGLNGGNPETSGGVSLGNLNYSGNTIYMRIKSTVSATIDITLSMSYNPSLQYDESVVTKWNDQQITTGFTVAKAEGAKYDWFDWHEYTIENLQLKEGVNELSLRLQGDVSPNYDYVKVDVNPVKETLAGIELGSMPAKTEYTEGQTFDATGMVINAVYESGAKAVVNDYTIDKTQLSVGDTSIVVSYKGFTVEVPITVGARTASVESLSYNGTLNKSTYYAGDYFIPAGIEVIANYTDGTSSVITDYEVSPLTAGAMEVEIVYKGKTLNIPVTVKEEATPAMATITSSKTGIYRLEAENATLANNTAMIEEHSASQNNPATSGGKSLGGLNYSKNTVKFVVNSLVDTVADIDLALSYNPSIDFDAVTATYWNGQKLTTGFVVAKTAGAQYEWFDWHTYTLEDVQIKQGINILEFAVLDVSANYDYVEIKINPVTELTLTAAPTKTAYAEGETFDASGMVVTATYADGTSETVTDYTVDKTMLVVEDTYVTVSYYGFTVQVPITVTRTATLDSLEIASLPTKTSYYAGQKFDTTGMVVMGYFSDGTSREITAYTLEEEIVGIGAEKIVVCYDGKSAEVAITSQVHITISETDSERKIEVENFLFIPNGNQSYQLSGREESSEGSFVDGLGSCIGAKFLLSINSEVETSIDLIVTTAADGAPALAELRTYVWNCETIETSLNSAMTWFPCEETENKIGSSLTLKKGLNVFEMTVNGNANEDYVKIVINPVRSIEVTNTPTKTEYAEGESFDASGMVVTATYADGTNKVVTDYTVDKTVLTSEDTFVTVSYKGLTVSVPVTVTSVASVESIEITSNPTKTTYLAGQAFDTADMVVTAHMSDGTSKEVSAYTVDKETLAFGDTKVTVSYEGKTAEVEVTVNVHATIAEGQSELVFDLENALYTPSPTASADRQMYTLAANNDSHGGYFLDGMDWMSGASFFISIHSEVASVFDFVITSAAPGGVSVDSVRDYNWNGEALTTGLTLANSWTPSASTEQKAASDLVLKAGTNVLVITIVGNGSANEDYIKFTVNPVRSIEATNAPTKTEYAEGESFDASGMVVTATYADGANKVVTDYTVDKTVLTSEDTFVTVSYKGLTVSVPVTVTAVASVESIEITSNPTKTAYLAGQTFDAAGMGVVAHMSDGTSKEVSVYEVDKTVLEVSDEKVTVSYEGKTAEVAISVTAHATFAEGQSELVFDLENGLYTPSPTAGADRQLYALTANDNSHGGYFLDAMDWMSGATFVISIHSEVEATVDFAITTATPANLSVDAIRSFVWNGEKLTTGLTTAATWTPGASTEQTAANGLTLKKGANLLVITILTNDSANEDYVKLTVK